MDLSQLTEVSEHEWYIAPKGKMRVPGIIFATQGLIREMDQKVYEQVTNVATLPGIVQASYAMPDAHWGYGFPIGGVAAFDADRGGVVSAGGVGFDISCGVRALYTGLRKEDIQGVQSELADLLYRTVPAGVGSTGRLHLDTKGMNAMLSGGAQWAVEQGYGRPEDLNRIEEHGRMQGALPDCVSDQAKKRQQDEMGTLGSGNHYLEIQEVVETFHDPLPRKLGIQQGDTLISIHCGSRGLGHQIGTEFLKKMVIAAGKFGITLPDRELACAPIDSPLGQEYLGAMRAAINCALANRQIVTHLVRQAFAEIFPEVNLPLMYDVSHNTCKVEEHRVGNQSRRLFVHRKGATRAFGPGHPTGSSGHRATGSDRRHDGNGLLFVGGHRGKHAHGLWIGLSRSRAKHEPTSGHQAVARGKGD